MEHMLENSKKIFKSITFFSIFQSISEYVGFEKLYEDISNSVSKVQGCKRKDLIATCQVLHDVHNEIGQCNSRECYKALVTKVKTILAKVVKNVEGGSRCSLRTMEPIAAKFRIVLKLCDMDVQKDLMIFSGKHIADVPVNVK